MEDTWTHHSNIAIHKPSSYILSPLFIQLLKIGIFNGVHATGISQHRSQLASTSSVLKCPTELRNRIDESSSHHRILFVDTGIEFRASVLESDCGRGQSVYRGPLAG